MTTEVWDDDELARIAQEMLGDVAETSAASDIPDDAPDEQEPDDGADTDDEVPEPEEEGGEPAPVEQPPADLASTLPPEQLASYLAFDAVLNARPDLKRFMDEQLRGGGDRPPEQPATVSPPPATLPEIPEEYLNDPAIHAIYEQNRALTDRLNSLNQQVTQVDQVTRARAQQEFATMAGNVKAAFAKEHSLDPKDVEAIAKRADEIGISRTIQPTSESIHQALTMTMRSMDEYHNRTVEDAVKARLDKLRKKQKLAGVGGGSGSTPREPATKPLTDEDRRKAMIEEVAADWFGQTQEAN